MTVHMAIPRCSASFVQSVDANGNASGASYLNYDSWGQPFYDGRVQMKQNLVFLLRAGLADIPFAFQVPSPHSLVGESNPNNYAFAACYHFNSGGIAYVDSQAV